MTPQSFLASHLKRLNGDLANAVRIFVEKPGDATMQVLLSAIDQRDAARAAAAAVELVDDRIYDSSGRWTGSIRGGNFMAERRHQAAAAEPDSREPPQLLSRRQKEI